MWTLTRACGAPGERCWGVLEAATGERARTEDTCSRPETGGWRKAFLALRCKTETQW